MNRNYLKRILAGIYRPYFAWVSICLIALSTAARFMASFIPLPFEDLNLILHHNLLEYGQCHFVQKAERIAITGIKTAIRGEITDRTTIAVTFLLFKLID